MDKTGLENIELVYLWQDIYSDGLGPGPGQLLNILNNPPGVSIQGFGVRQTRA